MSWLDHKDEMDTSGGRLRRHGAATHQKKGPEKVYSVSQVASMLAISRGTVFKWLSIDEPDLAVIPPAAWFKLPNGHIRIREWIVLKLQAGEI